MKTVVITGSSRGFGLAQAGEFKKRGWNVVLSATNEERLQAAVSELEKINPEGSRVIRVLCDIRKEEDLISLWKTAKERFGNVDIWVNNAGVNCPDKPVIEISSEEMSYVLDIDLKGTMLGSKVAFQGMKEQGFGQIYNTEGHGSNDMFFPGLTLYGTSKRALTYFTRALAKESEALTGGAVKVCRLTPGIMITDFILSANGGKTRIDLPEKTKKVYNILADYPEPIAAYCVPRMIANQKNDRKILWLTGRKAFFRYLTAGINKRDFFSPKEP